MASKRIDIMDVRQIIQLKIRGESNRSVSKITGIHRNTVNTYVRLLEGIDKPLAELQKLSDEELSGLFPSIGTVDKTRYETLSGQFEYFRKELKKPGCTRQVLWQEYLNQHPSGYHYTQFNEHLNRWLKRKKVSGKLEHKAGDKLYVDYSGKKLSYTDKSTGEIIEVEVFVGTLPCSGYTFVEASASQKLENFIVSMNNCLRYFGGVPKAIVPDNLKSAVTKGSKYEPVLNKTFKDFAIHYGCAVNPTRTYSPQDKALVENAVTLVYQRIFYPLSKMTFFSLEDLNKEIRRLLELYNDYELSNLKISRRQQFLTIEKSFLEALPSEDYEIRYFKRATVHKTGYVFLSSNKNYYSVPYRFIGKKVEVRYNSQTVDIQYNMKRIATHKRSFQAGKYTTFKDHLSSTHKFYKDWSPDFFEKLAHPHGASVVSYVKALIDQADYPEVAYKQCLGILSLSKSHEKNRLNNACKIGLTFRRCSYRIIENILKNKMDLQPAEPDSTNLPLGIEHENIRGANAFS